RRRRFPAPPPPCGAVALVVRTRGQRTRGSGEPPSRHGAAFNLLSTIAMHAAEKSMVHATDGIRARTSRPEDVRPGGIEHRVASVAMRAHGAALPFARRHGAGRRTWTPRRVCGRAISNVERE